MRRQQGMKRKIVVKTFPGAGIKQMNHYVKPTLLTAPNKLTRWSNLAKFLPLVRARIFSGHLTESGQFFEKYKIFNFSPQFR
jgi:hypothetical protein